MTEHTETNTRNNNHSTQASPPSSTSSQPQPSHTSASPAPVKKTSRKRTARIVGIIVCILALIGIGTAIGLAIAEKYGPNATPSLVTTNDGNKAISETESSIASVAERVAPSVVSIIAKTKSLSLFYGSRTSDAAGTGVIISKDGYVMTNNHVIESAREASIIDSEGELYKDVEVIGRDPLNDIAFLKINADKEFTPAQLGNSATIRTGQQVVAIGNALGQYKNTVTSGIISGTGRPVTASTSSGSAESLTDLIQTDASINPGNSGGPLVNLSGQVIGINTAIVEDANGIGFAIPINATKGIIAGVLETGKVRRAILGVNYLSITPDVAREYDLPVKAGAYIYTVDGSDAILDNGPADKAGLRRGDIITKINDDVIGEQGGLSTILGSYRPGDKVTLTYLRKGKEHTATVNLDAYQR